MLRVFAGCLVFAGVLLAPSTDVLAQAAAGSAAGSMDMQHTASTPSATLTVTGLNGKQMTYGVADLKAMPHTTVSVYNEHAKANESYSGVALTDLLAKAGAPTGEKLRGKGFLLYVVAEGTDHYKVVYSITETDPLNHAGDVIVADSLNGAPIGADGAFKLVNSEDKRPARWVRNLSAITLKSAE
jgi:DMSO/TMAO reductase YedYZ molybdopterin-dependent catalytic subunit